MWCTLRRFSEIDDKFAGPLIAGKRLFSLRLLHINEEFIHKYANQELPHLKGADHIFVAVAKLDGYTLITRDESMLKVCEQVGVTAMTPSQYLDEVDPFTRKE